jgi:nitronate monooxygenase
LLAFSFGDPTPYVAQAKEAGAHVVCQVQNREGARLALAAGADVLVAQGNEAGGHTGQLGTLPCLSLVLAASAGTPVIASGGIADSRSLAAVLAAGAEGAWIGTALLATNKATEIPDSYKQRIVSSDGHDTVFTTLYDTLFDLRFPAGIGARVAINNFTSEWDSRESALRQRRKEVLPTVSPSHLQRHDPDIDPTWMGQSAGMVNSVRPVADVVQGLCEDAEHILRERLSTLL